jgi:2-methylaconitate cis-trans-isomerase PrpF
MLDTERPGQIVVEHPSGQLEAQVTLQGFTDSGLPEIERVGIIRTVRLLFSGEVYVHSHILGENGSI